MKVSAPSGGHVLWLELPKQVDSIKLYEEALSHGIQVAPGPIFSASGGFRNYLRINTGFPWTADLEQQVARLARLIKPM